MDLNRETDRLMTFINNKFKNKYVSANDLAMYGFYFVQHPDTVQCAFCHLTLCDFEPHDIVWYEHLKYSPNCPLLINTPDNGNISIGEIKLPNTCYDVAGIEHKKIFCLCW